jgi:hypothetical protein
LTSRALDRLLLSLLVNPTGGDRLAGGTDEATQSQLAQRAFVHNAHVLLAWQVGYSPYLGEHMRRQLRHLRRVSVARDAQLTRATSGATSALREAGVAALAYKGPTLRQALGLPSPVRISSDIDLLVRPGDVGKAEAVFAGLGYRCAARSTYEANYRSVSRPPIDLHWSLLTVGGWGDRLTWLVGQVWGSNVTVDLGCGEVRTFSPTDTLLILAAHAGCHHLCSDWAALYEMAFATSVWSDRIDWTRLLRAAHAAGLAGALYYVLELAVAHFNAAAPAEVLSGCRPRGWRRPAAVIARAGFEGTLRADAAFRLSRIAWNLVLAPGLHSAARWTTARIAHSLRNCRHLGSP